MFIQYEEFDWETYIKSNPDLLFSNKEFVKYLLEGFIKETWVKDIDFNNIENVIIETVVIETEGGTSVKKHSKIKK